MEYQDKDNILECFGYHKKCLKIIFSLASYHLKHLLFGDYLFNLIEKKSHISRDLLGGVMKKTFGSRAYKETRKWLGHFTLARVVEGNKGLSLSR